MTDARPRPVLLRNGVVHSPADPFASAMLVDGDRVAWVGGEGAADGYAAGAVDVVDLDGALVTPAFVDAHVHLTETGLAAGGVALADATSLAEALDRVAAWARAHPGQQVTGHGWDERHWPEQRPPTAVHLQAAAPGVPVYLARIDVHSAVVSPELLRRAPEIADADGYDASGLVRRDAHHVARRATRDTLTDAQRRILQEGALRSAASLGIAAVHEMAAPHIGGPHDLATLRGLLDAHPDLPDVTLYWGGLDVLGGPDADAAHLRRALDDLGARGVAGDLCVDGSIGSRTAALHVDYADAAGERGHLYLEADTLTDLFVRATEARVQAGVHVIGDAGVALVVDALQSAASTCGIPAVVAARHRLEHLEMIDAAQVATLARLGVVASVQPGFDAAWGGDAELYAQRLGKQRASTMNPFADLSRAGVTVAFGSDSPVIAMGGWAGVRDAAYHRTPEQRLTVRGAFGAHTRGGWRAAGVDDAGVLAPGMLASYAVWDVAEADLVVQTPDERVAAWSTDPRSGVPGLPPLTAGSALPRCLQTVASGRVVHDLLG